MQSNFFFVAQDKAFPLIFFSVRMFLEENGHIMNKLGSGYEHFYEPELGL